MSNIRKKFSLLTISVLLFYLGFSMTTVNLVQVNITLTLATIYFLINYKISKNLWLYSVLLYFALGSYIAFTVVHLIAQNITESTFYYWSIYRNILVLFPILMFILGLIHNHKEKDFNDSKPIFNKRAKDLERIIEYLKSYNMIGIDSEWGTGKSFLTDKLTKNIDKEYEIIKINLLSCNLDDFVPFIIDELEKILKKYRLTSKSSKDIQRIFSTNSITSKIKDFIFPTSISYSDLIIELKNELLEIDKKILIFYEDIDRINKKEVIHQIFSISESLSSNHIKIIYQYDEKQLFNIGFDSREIEKFINYKLKLTPLDFFETIELFIQEKEITILSIKDFDFIRTFQIDFNRSFFKELFDLDYGLKLDVDKYNFRKIKHFLDEINLTLNNLEKMRENKRNVIAFFFVKHFMPKEFDRLLEYDFPFEEFSLEINGNKYTIKELIINIEESKMTSEDYIENSFEKEENRYILAIFGLFQYNFTNYKLKDKQSKQFNINNHNNEKIDRIIRKLAFYGKSNYTNNENFAKKFLDTVLSKPLANQKEAYLKLYETNFYSNEYTDNDNIYRFGSNHFIDLFNTFQVLNIDEDTEVKLIDFFFTYEAFLSFEPLIFKVLNKSNLNNQKIFYHVIKKTNKLDITSNFNSEKSFYLFLRTLNISLLYLGLIENLTFLEDIDVLEHLNDSNRNNDFFINWIKNLITDVKRTSDNLLIRTNFFDNDLKEIIHLLKNMILIMQNPNVYEPKPKTSPYSTLKNFINYTFKNSINYTEVERIKSLPTREEQEQEIYKAYSKGKLNFLEIQDLIKEENNVSTNNKKN